jgi:Ca2+-binding EF-hand superfamily protein
MTRKTLLTLAVLTALSAGTAFAATQSGTASDKPTRASLDINSDGLIDRTEAAKSPRLLENFDSIDVNKDGKLSKEEMPRRGERGDRKHGGRGDGARDAMAKLDTDKDGRISRAESAAGEGKFATRFDQMDVNKDGYVDRADHELRSKQRKDEWFASADTNKDGQLSRAEVDAAKPTHGGRGGDRPPAPQSK